MSSIRRKITDNIFSIVEILPVCEGKGLRLGGYLLIVLAAGYCAYLYHHYKFNFSQWDFLLLTGLACFYIGIQEVGTLKDRFERMLKRLMERGVILDSRQQTFEEIKVVFESKAISYMRGTGLLCALAMLAAFVVALIDEYSMSRALLGGAEMIGAYVAGNYLGRMVWYGRLGHWLAQDVGRYRMDPCHVDGLCGFKPIGEYYFYQASIALIPAIFLAVWWLLIPIWPRDYLHWHDPYFGLLIVAVIIEILAFIMPLYSVHRLMSDRKKELISEADLLSAKITELKSAIVVNEEVEQSKILKDKLDEISERYWAIENMNTWPVDMKTKKRFSINNLFLLLPVVYNSFQHTFKIDDLLKVLSKLQF